MGQDDLFGDCRLHLHAPAGMKVIGPVDFIEPTEEGSEDPYFFGCGSGVFVKHHVPAFLVFIAAGLLSVFQIPMGLRGRQASLGAWCRLIE